MADSPPTPSGPGPHDEELVRLALAGQSSALETLLRHLLDRKRSRPELSVASFDCYAGYLDRAPDEEPADLFATLADTQLLVEEAKQTCLLGMLLCLTHWAFAAAKAG